MLSGFPTMAGTICIALAPVPTTATRRPERSRSSGQRAEWKSGPSKRSSPGRSGVVGRLSCPTAEISSDALRVSLEPSARRTTTSQRRRSSSQDGRLDGDAELDVAAQVGVVGVVAQVVEHLAAAPEGGRPGVRAERVGVEVAGGVDPGARVAVLPPGAGDLVVALQCGHRDAHRAQRRDREEPADAGADDERVGAVGDARVRGRLGLGDAEGLGHHRLELLADGLAGEGAQHPQEQLAAGRGQGRGSARLDRRGEGVADLVLDLVGKAAGVVVVEPAGAGRARRAARASAHRP